ncbi:transposase [Myxosarcina sp. GI1(2024)]
MALDRESVHVSQNLTVPQGIHLVWMPPKSPELQPAERLWPLTNEALANQTFDNLDGLEEVIVQRCRTLLRQPKLVRGLTNYHW